MQEGFSAFLNDSAGAGLQACSGWSSSRLIEQRGEKTANCMCPSRVAPERKEQGLIPCGFLVLFQRKKKFPGLITWQLTLACLFEVSVVSSTLPSLRSCNVEGRWCQRHRKATSLSSVNDSQASASGGTWRDACLRLEVRNSGCWAQPVLALPSPWASYSSGSCLGLKFPHLLDLNQEWPVRFFIWPFYELVEATWKALLRRTIGLPWGREAVQWWAADNACHRPKVGRQ